MFKNFEVMLIHTHTWRERLQNKQLQAVSHITQPKKKKVAIQKFPPN